VNTIVLFAGIVIPVEAVPVGEFTVAACALIEIVCEPVPVTAEETREPVPIN
jgi:hypothetical protein